MVTLQGDCHYCSHFKDEETQTQRDEVITQSHIARPCSQALNPSSLAVEFVFMYGMYTISEQLADFIKKHYGILTWMDTM